MTRDEFVAAAKAEWEADCMRWRGRTLTGRYPHWCWDWDGLPVDDTTPEWPCACYRALPWWERLWDKLARFLAR